MSWAIKVDVQRCLVSVEFALESGAGMGLQMEWLLIVLMCVAQLGTPVAGELEARDIQMKLLATVCCLQHVALSCVRCRPASCVRRSSRCRLKMLQMVAPFRLPWPA